MSLKMDLTNLSTIKSILIRHDLWAKKRFGQNFLINKEVLDRIVETGEIASSDHVIEIGPGLGVLTQELSKAAKKVTSIELDRTLLQALNETLKEFTNIKILNEDALKFIPPKSKYKIIANIPYNITSPLINHFLQAEFKPTTITLLVQKEVAEKICQNGTILSLQVALFGVPKLIKKVDRSSFYPSPNVDSAILHIKVYQKSDENFISLIEALKILSLAKRAFSQRRKKLSNTLGQYKEILINLGIQDKRPEALSIKEWQELADEIEEKEGKNL